MRMYNVQIIVYNWRSRLTMLWTVLITLSASLIMLNSCDVHEFPDVPETRPLIIQVQTGNLNMQMLEQGYTAHARSISSGSETLTEGTIRYTLRAYPIVQGSTMKTHSHEFTFLRDIADGFDNHFAISLPAGDYTIMTWADLSEKEATYFYDITDFSAITLLGQHVGSTDYRDAFRGKAEVYVPNDYLEHPLDTLCITLDRPLAKFEFITTDLQEFVDKELRRIADKDHTSDTDLSTTKLNLANYQVRFNYTGYMPNTYSLFTDKPIDSAVGIRFDSNLIQLSADEASMGFDYVFVNGSEQTVELQLQLIDADNMVIAQSERIQVELRRNQHTIIKGAFLTKQVSGGVVINPDYEGDHNIVLP